MPTHPHLRRERARSSSPSLRSPRASPQAASPLAAARGLPPFVELPPPCALVEAGPDATPLFATPPTRPAKDATPTSVLEVANALMATKPAAGWGPETRATTNNAELESEHVDRELEHEFDTNERYDRALFAGFPRPMPCASKRGIPPNAPFMPCM